MNFSTYFPNLDKYFPKCEGKGSFLKSQIKSLTLFNNIRQLMIYSAIDCFSIYVCITPTKRLNAQHLVEY